VRAQQIACGAEDIERAFAMYQSSFPRIRQLRMDYFRAFEKAVQGWPTEHAHCTFRGLSDVPGAPTVVIELPTGRSLYYCSVKVTQESTAWGMRRALWFAPGFGGKGKSPAGSHRHKRRVFDDGVLRNQLTPQVIVENIVQAVARDVMVHQALELEHRGLRVAWHAHDEIVVATDGCGCSGPCGPDCPWARAGKELVDVMSHVPDTLPRLADLPLSCALHERVRATYAA
jgi:hypothetical protein